MKTFSLLLTPLLTLVLCGHRCVAGQADEAAVGVGEWSEAVSDGDGQTLRGRLVVCNDLAAGASNHARVYLELEHVIKGGFTSPVEVYYDIEGNSLNLELRDGHDQPVPRTPMNIRAPMLRPYWVTLPCDATVRLRSDLYHLSVTPTPEGLQLMLGSGYWLIPTIDSTSSAAEFYLSGTFTPPADHPSALKYDVWQGTLKLPKVKIPPPKAVQVAVPARLDTTTVATADTTTADTTNDADFANKIVEVFRDCQKIKPDMTRAELARLQMFDEDGRPLSSANDKSFKPHATFYYRSCSLIKVDVDFRATSGATGAKEAQPADLITKVSMPYIDARPRR